MPSTKSPNWLRDEPLLSERPDPAIWRRATFLLGVAGSGAGHAREPVVRPLERFPNRLEQKEMSLRVPHRPAADPPGLKSAVVIARRREALRRSRRRRAIAVEIASLHS